MKTTKSRSCSRVATFLSILLATVLVATGCAQKVSPIVGSETNMMVETNVTSSEYDTVPLLWNIGQNAVVVVPVPPVVHVSDFSNGGILCWQNGSSIRVVQQWSYLSKKPLLTTTSKDANLLTPPEGMQYLSTEDGGIRRWYASDENAFVSVPAQPGLPNETLGTKTIAITEQGVASGSKAQTLTVPLPPDVALAVKVPGGMLYSFPLYGSGSIKNGFVLFSIPVIPTKNIPSDDLWLLHIKNGESTWTRCGDLSAFGGSIISGQDPSFARVGSLLYFTHSHTKIACIDTAAASPSVTLPETLNALLAKLYREGPTNAEGPLQALLASDNGMLIIEYPDANWNGLYYAVDASGTVLGSLRSDKTSITSFDAKEKRGSSTNAPGSISFPSIDLFQ